MADYSEAWLSVPFEFLDGWTREDSRRPRPTSSGRSECEGFQHCQRPGRSPWSGCWRDFPQKDQKFNAKNDQQTRNRFRHGSRRYIRGGLIVPSDHFGRIANNRRRISYFKREERDFASTESTVTVWAPAHVQCADRGGQNGVYWAHGSQFASGLAAGLAAYFLSLIDAGSMVRTGSVKGIPVRVRDYIVNAAYPRPAASDIGDRAFWNKLDANRPSGGWIPDLLPPYPWTRLLCAWRFQGAWRKGGGWYGIWGYVCPIYSTRYLLWKCCHQQCVRNSSWQAVQLCTYKK